jgi:hypothetical protein
MGYGLLITGNFALLSVILVNDANHIKFIEAALR